LPPPNPEPLLRSSRPHNPRKKLQDYMCSTSRMLTPTHLLPCFQIQSKVHIIP
jgi:hypothetical protein